MKIKSFVFLDTETTGLPSFEHNKTRITELCLICVQAEHILLGVTPRVQNKLNLCFNPMRRIQPEAERITGLYNDDLDNESTFDEVSLNVLINFLSRLAKPVCFVAHNGFKFDYPILRTHIEKAGAGFPDDVLCTDSLVAFRHILDSKSKTEASSGEKVNAEKEVVDLSDDWDDLLYEEVLRIEEEIDIASQKYVQATPSKKSGSKQVSNETTPPVKKQCNVPAAPKHRRMRSGHPASGSSKPPAQRWLDFETIKTEKPSFKLGDVYERLVEKSPKDAHHAEADVQMLLDCAVHLGEVFIDWANQNAVPFDEIPKMEPGKKIGFQT